MMRKLGVAVIGVGYWGQNHVRVLNEIDKAELKAVCDVDLGKVKRIGMNYRVPYFTDSKEVLKDDNIEAVSICIWPTALAKEAKKALEAGKHVLVEKPMAASSEEARELIKLAEKEDLVLMVGFVERFNPGVNYVRRLVRRGDLGDVVVFNAKRLSRWPIRPWDIGVLKDLAIHDIDLSRYILGEEPETVFARVGRLRRSDVNDYALVLLSFPNGKVASIEANWLTPYKKRELSVTGSEAVVILNYLTQEVTIEKKDGAYKPATKWLEPLRLELEHFVECVLTGKEPRASGLDGLIALRICELALKSSSRSEVIRIPKNILDL